MVNKFILSFFMNNNPKIRRRISFTPIMLTSKSIRPVDRSDYQIMRHQRKISGIKRTREDLTHYLFRESGQFGITTSAFQRGIDYDGQEESNLCEETQQESMKQLIKKMTTPSVVKMEFQNEVIRNRKKIDSKNKQGEQSLEGRLENNRFVYYANAKTFEQFSKMAKIKNNKKADAKEEHDEDWKKYLDKYYLNIRKVKPLLKRDTAIHMLSPQRIINISEIRDKSKQQNVETPSVLMRFKSNTQIRSQSKRQTVYRKSRLQSPKEQQSQRQHHQQFRNNSVYRKIEQDINNNKSGGHKKDFFVFGLSEGVSKTAEAIAKNKFDNYKDFIFRINFTNGLYVKYRQQSEKQLKFFVGFGNNSAIIKGIMRRRFWWQMVDKIADDTNFIWTQLKLTEVFKAQNCSSIKIKFPRYKQFKQKDQECESTGLQKSSDSSDYNKAIMSGEDFRIWGKYLQKNQKYQEKGFQNCIARRVTGLLKKKDINLIQNAQKLKTHNHLQCNYFLGNKKALFYSLRKYYELQKTDPFTKIPLTFHINQGIQDPEFDRFLLQFEKQGEKKKVQKDFRNIWIVKPGQLTNRGRGITVCSTLDQIKIRIKSKQRNSNGSSRTFIIQKYIEKPLLYQRRKFDIRHYMMITCHNGKMKGYWYADGYIRTTSSEYNIKNTKDLMNHLTNDAVQKCGQDYGKYQKGNKLSYSEFQKYLINTVSAEADFNKQILPKMKQLAAECVRATYSVLDHQRKQHNFELFGLDFMLDQLLNVYLIEVNTNPCLQTSCPLLTKIITPLVENVFKIGLDPLFPPPYDWPSQKKYNLGDNAMQENKFTIIFDETEEGEQLRQLYKHTSRIDEKMGDIYEQEEEYQDQQKEWNDEEEQVKKQK